MSEIIIPDDLREYRDAMRALDLGPTPTSSQSGE